MTRRDVSLHARILLVVVSVFTAFAFCEIAARLRFPEPPDDMRQPQITYQYDSKIGYVLSPSQSGWSNDGYMTVNSLGFRGPEVDTPKPAGRFRVAVIGDSVTAGLGVADRQTFPSQLQQLLRQGSAFPDAEVVNLAVSGYNTAQEVALLDRYVGRVEPDVVLVGFYVNDVWGSLDDPLSNDGGTRIAANHPADGQVLRMSVSDRAWWEKLLRKSRAAYLAGRAFTRMTQRGEWATSRFRLEQIMLEDGSAPELEAGWQKVEQALERLRTMSDGRYPVGLVALPCKEQVTGQYRGTSYQRRLRQIAAGLGFFVVDPLPALAAGQAEADLFIPYDRNHENAAGHRVIASTIAQQFEQHPELVHLQTTASDGHGDSTMTDRTKD